MALVWRTNFGASSFKLQAAGGKLDKLQAIGYNRRQKEKVT